MRESLSLGDLILVIFFLMLRLFLLMGMKSVENQDQCLKEFMEWLDTLMNMKTR